MNLENVCGKWHLQSILMRLCVRGLGRRLWRFGACWETGRLPGEGKRYEASPPETEEGGAFMLTFYFFIG